MDVLPGLTDGGDLLRVLVWDLEPGVLLECVDELDEVEGVGVQVFLERRVHRHLFGLTTEALDDDVLEVLEAQLLSFHTRTTVSQAPRRPWERSPRSRSCRVRARASSRSALASAPPR